MSIELEKKLEEAMELNFKTGYIEALTDILSEMIELKKTGYLVTIDMVVDIIIKLRNK